MSRAIVGKGLLVTTSRSAGHLGPGLQGTPDPAPATYFTNV